MSELSTPPLVFEAVRGFLRKHPPFSLMSDDALAFMIPRLKLAYFPKHTVIVERHASGFPPLHIVNSGEVASVTAGLDTLPDRVLGPGECFPVGALSTGGAPTRSYRALTDVFAYQLRVDDFRALRRLSPPFEAYCTEAITTLAQQSVAELQRHYGQVAAEQQTLTRPLGELVRRPPVTCPPGATLRQAIEAMRDHGVRLVAIVDEAQRALGIFTLNDLRDRVVLAEVPLDTPITEVMTRDVQTLPVDATAAEAIQQMAQSGFHQTLVADAGRLVGVVSERDLFALQRVSVRQINQSIRQARSLKALGHVAADIRNLAHNLLAQGVAAEPLTRTISALNDALTREALAQVAAEHRLPAIGWCWLALGSEGRGEQTLATDQDNAIIFAPAHASTGTSERRALLAFAREANQALDALGFPLCRGNIMAGNADWCLTEDEWRDRFRRWLSEPTPEALLNANIFFDLRPLAGARRLAEQLRDWLLARTQGNTLFIRLLVANALQTEPSLGLLRAFAVDDGDSGAPGTIDLKKRGTRIFVDAARAFALALGLPETGTAARLRRAGERLGVEPRHVSATVDAFHFLQVLRLRTQEAAERDQANRIDPYALNDIDQRLLKEALRQARKLQERLQSSLAPR
jgi:CBS domain-containing protein